ncbi:MAG: aldehyde dehydrogenase family protein [Anaerolineae bacterium]|nr:aldehyde dehydrogenase family protein [Anaerolineae bacterium]
MIRNQNFVDGKWAASRSGKRFETVNPATEEVIADVPRGDASDIDAAVRAADAAMKGEWSKLAPAERGRLIFKLARAIEAHSEELARLETADNGKPLRDALGDMEGVVSTLEFNAGAADKLQGDTIALPKQYVDFTWLEPLGVTGHIIPWNFPLGMATRSIAPALTAGCTVVLKPAEQTPLTALRFAELAQEVGLPDGVLNVVTGFGPESGAALVEHPLVRGITFTGSVETGKLIMRAAAATIKPVVLELGGKNALIVFPDADLNKALDDVMEGIFHNCGQVCSAISRLVLHRDIHDEFVECLRARVSKLTVGPGMSNPDIGPLVSEEQYTRVHNYLALGKENGARVVLGGGRPKEFEKGYFVEPTIFDRVSPDARIAQEEIFGPVVAAMTFETEDEAVAIANGVPYGLSSGVHTQNITRALRLARRLQTGSVWINEWYIGGVQAPTGGYKESGFGRERGLAGIMNYVQVKNVGIRI